MGLSQLGLKKYPKLLDIRLFKDYICKDGYKKDKDWTDSVYYKQMD